MNQLKIVQKYMIRCCRCDNLYDLELLKGNSKHPIIVCPHCGYKHLVNFTLIDDDNKLEPFGEIKLGATADPVYSSSRLLDIDRTPLAADETAVIDWPIGDELIVALQMDEEKGPWTATYQLRWRNVTDGGSFAALGSTGEIRWGTATDLVNGAAITSASCSNVPAGSSWANGEEIEGASTSDSITLADEEYTETHYAINTDGSIHAKEYEFELYESTNSTSLGTSSATLTVTDGSLQTTKTITGVAKIIDNQPSTIALGTNIVDTATGVSVNPTFEFTGTDGDGDDVEYNVQVDTANTFDSGTSLLDSYSETNGGTGSTISDTDNVMGGQSFLGDGKTLSSFKASLAGTDSPANDFVVRVYAHTGTFGTDGLPTGSILATSDSVSATTLTTHPTFGLVEFTFTGANKIILEDSTPYFIMVEYENADTGYILFNTDNTSPTHEGNFAHQWGGTWYLDSGFDGCFYVYTSDTLLDKVSETDTGFANVTTPANTHPFNSGDLVDYDIQGAIELESHPQSNSDAAYQLIVGQTVQVAESFVSDGSPIKSIGFYIGKEGSPQDVNITASIYAYSGTRPDGPALATSNSDTSILPSELPEYTSSWLLHKFSFDTKFIPTNGVSYCISLNYSGTGDNDNNVKISYDSSSNTYTGYMSRSVSGSTWLSLETFDLIFYLYDDDTLEELTTYYWRARAIDPLGSDTYSDWSATRSFTTEAGSTTTTKTIDGVSKILVTETTTKTQTGVSNITVGGSTTKTQNGVANIKATTTKTIDGTATISSGIGEMGFLQSTEDASDSTSYTFSDENIGTADGARSIIVVIASRKAGANTVLNSVSIGGVSATITIQQDNSATNSNIAAIAVAAVPSGTTGDIVVAFDSTMSRCAIGVYRATNLDSITAHDFGSSVVTNPTYDIDVPAGGFAIGGISSSGDLTMSWAGITEDYDGAIETYMTYSGASDTFASEQTALTLTVTPSGSTVERAGVFASWGFSGDVTTTKTQDGVSRIKDTLTKTQDGLARIETTEDKTINGVSNILVTEQESKTQTGVARIEATVDEIQYGTARIEKTVTKTITGQSRINIVTTQDQDGVARVTSSLTETIDGTSRIETTVDKTIDGLSRIKTQETKDQDGLARITTETTKTITGLAKIAVTGTSSKTITGKSNVKATTTQIQYGNARIETTEDKVIDGVARVGLVTSKTIAGISTIETTTDKAIDGLSRITTTEDKTVDGVARVKTTEAKDIDGLARIETTSDETITGLSKIVVTGSSSQTQTGTADIKAPTTENQFGTSRITTTEDKTIDGVSRIGLVTTKDQSGVARVEATESKDQSGVARIETTNSETQDGLARIKTTVDETQDGVSRIETIEVKDITGLAKVVVTGTSSQTITGKANVKSTTDRIQYGTARIETTVSETIDGLARIETTEDKTIDGIARVETTSSETQDGVARIQKTESSDIDGLARIGLVTTKPQEGLARIETTVTETITGLAKVVVTGSSSQTITGKANVKATTDKDQFGAARIETTESETTDGLARIGLVTSKSQDGLARVTTTSDKTITGLAKVVVTGTSSQTQTGVANIKTTTDQNQFGTARIETTVDETIDGVSRIKTTSSETQDGLARIETTSDEIITGVAEIAVSSTTSKTITGTASIHKTRDKHITGVAEIVIEEIAEKTITGVASISSTTYSTPEIIFLVDSGIPAKRLSNNKYIIL